MKILVIGASGFIGRNLLLRLKTNDKVVAVYNKSNDFKDFLSENNINSVLPICVDLSKAEELYKILEFSSFFEVCIYLAANSDPAVSVEKPAYDLITNSLALINLLENIAFDKFIYFSSGAIYDGIKGAVSPNIAVNPKLPYAISKLASERYLNYYHKSGTIKQLTIVRFFGAYGPYEPPRKIYTRLVKRFGVERNPHFTIRGDGKNLINAMYIDDAIKAIFLILDKINQKYILFDLHAEESITIITLVKRAAEIFNINPIINYEGNVPEYIQFYSIDKFIYDNLGFKQTVDLREGLLKLYEHIQHKLMYDNDKKLYRDIISSN